MSGNYAVFVDAGFLMAAGARALGRARRGLSFDGTACVDWFTNFHRVPRYDRPGRIFRDKVFLRAYWYDGAFEPLDPRFLRQRATFELLADVPGLYLRLGHLRETRPAWQHPVQKAVQACGVSLGDFAKHFQFRSELEQKGVDALMTLDLVSLSRDRAVDAILLVSGDRDLEEAVRVAQGVGCKVVLAYPAGAGVAPALRQLADARLRIEAADLQKMLVPFRPAAVPQPVF